MENFLQELEKQPAGNTPKLNYEGLSRRKFLRLGGMLAAFMGFAGGVSSSRGYAQERSGVGVADGSGPYRLPDLGYRFDGLEPHIDTLTMETHYGKHHAGYVRNLNAALHKAGYTAPEDPQDLLRSLSDLPESLRRAVRNNGGGHVNHTLFWSILSPNGGGEASGELAARIQEDFGSEAVFRDQFQKAALSIFGSGWAWLCVDRNGHLTIEATPNQDHPLMSGLGLSGNTPILGLDVWEHAYYLRYQNRRAEYIGQFWNILDWSTVGRHYANARAS